MTRIRLAITSVSILFLFPVFAVQAEVVRLDPESLWKWSYVADPQISPDGSRIAYVRVDTDREKDRYRAGIWMLDRRTGRHKPFTTSEANDLSPRWSPDGTRIAFLSNRGTDNKTQIYIIDADGGEARRLTELKEGAGSIAWSPDGSRIAFTSRTLTPDEAKARKEEESDAKKAAREARGADENGALESAPEPVVIEELRYQQDGVPGFLTGDRTHIWIVETSEFPSEATRITHGDFDHGAPEWGAGGAWLYFSAILKEDADYLGGDSEIYRVRADGSTAPEALTDRVGPDTAPAVSPDGEWIAYLGYDMGDPPVSYAVMRLLVMRPDGSDTRLISADFDRDIASGASNDVASPMGGGQRLQWSADSQSIYFTVASEGRVGLGQARRSDGHIEEITTHPMGEILAFSLAADGTVAVVYSNPTTPADLYEFSVNQPERLAWTRRTEVNADALAEVELARYEERWFDSFDGMRIQGWLIKPPNFDASKQWPLILYIHGGPHIMYGANFFHEFQMLAQSGYVVLITNPRGSAGYGETFGNIIQYKYPGDDYKDLMAAVDAVLAEGFIDPARMGVTGGSGGGLLTSWTIGQTDRFAAAVTQRSVINWYSFVGTADFNYFFATRWFEDFPWNDPESYLRRSPIAYAGNITTPLLIIHSLNDYRTPFEQDQQLYTALKMQRKTAKMVVFPEASHGLSRAGRPSQRIARLNHIRDWFNEYLLAHDD